MSDIERETDIPTVAPDGTPILLQEDIEAHLANPDVQDRLARVKEGSQFREISLEELGG